MLASSRL